MSQAHLGGEGSRKRMKKASFQWKVAFHGQIRGFRARFRLSFSVAARAALILAMRLLLFLVAAAAAEEKALRGLKAPVHSHRIWV